MCRSLFLYDKRSMERFTKEDALAEIRAGRPVEFHQIIQDEELAAPVETEETLVEVEDTVSEPEPDTSEPEEVALAEPEEEDESPSEATEEPDASDSTPEIVEAKEEAPETLVTAADVTDHKVDEAIDLLTQLSAEELLAVVTNDKRKTVVEAAKKAYDALEA